MSVDNLLWLWILGIAANFYFADFLYKKRWVRKWSQDKQDFIALLFALTSWLLPLYLLVDTSIAKIRRNRKVRAYHHV